MHPIDILVVTALREEAFACEQWLGESRMQPPLEVHFLQDRSARIGLFCIGEKGGVGAAVRVSPVVEHYRPRLVLLVGIAAGPKGTVGQVGLPNRVLYISHGKVSEGRIRPEVRKSAQEVTADERLERYATRLKGGAWAEQVKEWFYKLHEDWHTRFPEEFPKQRWPQRGVGSVFVGDIASGEMVIADGRYQEHVRNQFPSHDIKMFEMESYAVGRVCGRLKVPFFTVRGISDDGTARKDSAKEKDRYRLAATLVASAFTKELIWSESFLEQYVIPTNRSTFYFVNKCLDPAVTFPCPHQAKCVEGGIEVRESRRNSLVKVYENVQPKPYSEAFASQLDSEEWKRSRVSLFFPYSTGDLLEIIGRSLREEGRGDEWVPRLVELSKLRKRIIRNNSRGDARSDDSEHFCPVDREIIGAIERLVRVGLDLFPHFRACERLAEHLETGSREVVAHRISRIILLDEEPDYDDPLLLLYPLLLGKKVPTFWALKSHLELSQLAVDDIIFIERQPGSVQGGGSDRWLLALRFFERSRLLAVAGWFCEASGKLGYEGLGALGRISGLYEAWNKDLRTWSGDDWSGTVFRVWDMKSYSEFMDSGKSWNSQF